MTILDPAVVANLAVYLVQLPRNRTVSRRQSTSPPPVEFTTLEHARAAGEVVISETGATERVRLENHSKRDLFIQAGEILRGGNQDRAVAGDLIIPAPRHEPEGCIVPVFCAEPERSVPMRGWTPDLFTLFDQICPGHRLKKELRLGTQEDVWREITGLRDAVFDIISYSGTRATPPYSLWVLNELLDSLGWLTPYIHPLLPLPRSHQEATGVVFVLGGRFNSAELYATPALFRQMWPKLLWAMTVEALVEQKTGEAGQGNLPTKGEVTAWLAGSHARQAAQPHAKFSLGGCANNGGSYWAWVRWRPLRPNSLFQRPRPGTFHSAHCPATRQRNWSRWDDPSAAGVFCVTEFASVQDWLGWYIALAAVSVLDDVFS